MSNHFEGVGNLGGKPPIAIVTRGTESVAVLDLRIYFDRRVPAEAEGEFDERGGFWLNASLWGERAERAEKLLTKGMRVFVRGSLVNETWSDSETGESRSALKLRVNYLALDVARLDAVTPLAAQSRRAAA